MEFKLNTNTLRPLSGAGRKLFVETYGCQMNVGDTEVVVALMQREGYVYTEDIGLADVILINTCCNTMRFRLVSFIQPSSF